MLRLPDKLPDDITASMALMTEQPAPKSLTFPGLLAHITYSKYHDALPLYRQETILQTSARLCEKCNEQG